MSNVFVTVIAKTHSHADNFASCIYPTLNHAPIRGSLAMAESCLRAARNRIIYLVDLELSEISYLKQLHGSRNIIFVVYWQEPAT